MKHHLLLNGLRGEALEGRHRHVGDDGVEVLALATLGGLRVAVHAHAHAAGDTLHALVPDVRVQGRVDAVILGLHELGHEGLDALDGQGRALVEGLLLEQLRQVDGRLHGHVVRLAAGARAQGRAGRATNTGVLGGVADAVVLLALLVAHLGEHALPALVVAVLAALHGLLAALGHSLALLLADGLDGRHVYARC
ncbi:large subunit ribosomal protein L31e [Strigomonas culicis]|uniref:Large subunit ribosomal protein L31e n=1 Tax=Strigomonas culicis TaxID=28005 RepID=S9UEK5_9TRYP|nr:large subunit ribosomal protein L31e [Strigomonas culicis]|eukprot:EPY27119.1 large subunit ribosomal protein L31e [Strigomonas culicis]